MKHLTVVPANAGDMNKLTGKLRSSIKLTSEQRIQAKHWRESGLEFWEIAEEMELDEDDVKLALANMRTKRKNPPRKTLNVTVAAFDVLKVVSEANDEPMWKTVNRFLGIVGE